MDSFITDYMELPKRIQIPKDVEITVELIKKIIKIHENNIKRYQILQEYYEGKAKILERNKDVNKANNKLILDYPSYIVDILLGLFVGKPISYAVNSDDEDKMEQIQEILNLNEEQDENTELAKMASIKGRAYEIVYLDENGDIQFNEVQPDNIIMVYSDEIKPDVLCAIYITDLVNEDNIDKEKKDKRITLYHPDVIREYNVISGNFSQTDEYINPFNEVPVIEFLNNNEGIGDFERVIRLIDAMNLAQSDTSNDFEEFTDAILVLYGMLDTDNEDIQQLLEDKVMLLDASEGSKQSAEWLIKQINDVALENYKTRMDADIHKFAKVPNLNDESFAGNVSGEAMKYKLFATSQIIAQKQRKFKTSLQKRLKLILSILAVKTRNDLDYRNISIVFNENTPFNELDNINTVKAALDAGLSKQYALGKLRDIDDINKELQRQEDEKDAYSEAFKAIAEANNEHEERISGTGE